MRNKLAPQFPNAHFYAKKYQVISTVDFLGNRFARE